VYPPGPKRCQRSGSKTSSKRKKKRPRKDWSASPEKRLKQSRIDTFYASSKPKPTGALQLDRFPPGGSPSTLSPALHIHSTLPPRRTLRPLHVQPVGPSAPPSSHPALATPAPLPLPELVDWSTSCARETSKRTRYLAPLRTTTASSTDEGPQPLRAPFSGNCDTRSRPVACGAPSGKSFEERSQPARTYERSEEWRRLCEATSTSTSTRQLPKAPQGIS
jgi:hypothetical protein